MKTMSAMPATKRPNVGAIFSATVDHLAAARFKRETARMHTAQKVVEEAAHNRRVAAQELRDLGWTYQRIADLIPGGHVQNIHRLLNNPRKKD